MLGIIQIDMHIRDRVALAYIKRQIKMQGGEAQISHETIGEKLGCHRNTAAAIVKRLIAAGHVEADDSFGKRGGYVYRSPKKH